ncbi:hypothetical protein Tco_0805343 [Tanacetum coccineum]
MAGKEAKLTTRMIVTNDQTDYYSGITSITVNRKNAYELKRKFLDDLHKNAFCGTHGEDAVKHIEYFLKIVDPIDLPNVNQDKLRVVVFPISLAGDAWRWFDRIKGSITSWVDLTAKFFGKYYPHSRTDKVNTPIIKWDPTNPKFKKWLASKFVYYKTMDIFTKGALRWKEDGYYNGENLPGAYIVRNILRYQDLEWYDTLKDSELKDKALRNKAIMEGLIDEDDESSNNGWRRWDIYEITDHDQEEREYENGHEVKERCKLFDNHELPVFNIRKFEMIKYSFRDNKEYVAVKEDEYDELTNTSKEAIHAYREIFCMMDEGWMVTRTV